MRILLIVLMLFGCKEDETQKMQHAGNRNFPTYAQAKLVTDAGKTTSLLRNSDAKNVKLKGKVKNATR